MPAMAASAATADAMKPLIVSPVPRQIPFLRVSGRSRGISYRYSSGPVLVKRHLFKLCYKPEA